MIASRRVRVLSVVALLLVLFGCTATPTKDPAAAPTTVTTWDGAVLRTPGLDIPIRADRLFFAFHNGTTLYEDPHGKRGHMWHVVYGDQDIPLDGETPLLSSNGQWVVTYQSTVQKFVRRNVLSGTERVLSLPAATITCCDAGGTTSVQGVTDTGLVILQHVVGRLPMFVWDGTTPPEPLKAGQSYAGTWPRGIVVANPGPDVKAGSYDLLAVGADLQTRRVGTIGVPAPSWSPDARTYLAQDPDGFTIGRLRGDKVTEVPLTVPAGAWSYSAWESPTTVVLAHTDRRLVARAVLRCDALTLLCVETTDPPHTSLPNL